MKNKIIFLALNLLISSFAFSMAIPQSDKAKSGQELIQACINNDLEKVKELIKSGVNTNFYSINGGTALIWASANGHTKIVKLLIKAGANVNAKDKKNLITPIIWASTGGHKKIVELLIKAGADLNIKDKYGSAALLDASIGDHKEIAEILIKAGADVNIKNNVGLTALMQTSRNGYKEVAKLLIESGADINVKDKYENTALIWASIGDHKEIVELLIKAEADVNAKDKDGNTAFIFASRMERKDAVDCLIKSVNSWKKEVYKAIDNKDFENFKKYILKIGTICFRDKGGNNLLHYAMEHGNIEFTKLIFSLKPELIAQVNKDGQTPLSFIGANGEFITLFRNFNLDNSNSKKTLGATFGRF